MYARHPIFMRIKKLKLCRGRLDIWIFINGRVLRDIQRHDGLSISRALRDITSLKTSLS